MPGGGGGMSSSEIADLATYQTNINRPDINSPIYGGTQWHQQIATDPNDPNFGRPNWIETQTLTPTGQARVNMANDLASNLRSDMKPWDNSITAPTYDPSEQQQQAYNFSKGNMDPQWAIQEQQLKGQMAAQGLHPGDPGYNQAMNQFQNQKQQAYGQALSGSYQTGAQTGATEVAAQTQAMQAQIARNLAQSGWTLGQINALLGGQGMPGAPGGGMSAAPDLIGNATQMGLAQQQMGQQGMNNLISSGAVIGAAAISDVNAKEDFSDAAPALEEFLQSAEPAEYSYRPEVQSLGGEGRYVSPMAQGLERSQMGRSMVVDTPVGKVVDYGKSFGNVLASLSYLNRKLNGIMGL